MAADDIKHQSNDQVLNARETNDLDEKYALLDKPVEKTEKLDLDLLADIALADADNMASEREAALKTEALLAAAVANHQRESDVWRASQQAAEKKDVERKQSNVDILNRNDSDESSDDEAKVISEMPIPQSIESDISAIMVEQSIPPVNTATMASQTPSTTPSKMYHFEEDAVVKTVALKVGESYRLKTSPSVEAFYHHGAEKDEVTVGAADTVADKLQAMSKGLTALLHNNPTLTTVHIQEQNPDILMHLFNQLQDHQAKTPMQSINISLIDMPTTSQANILDRLVAAYKTHGESAVANINVHVNWKGTFSVLPIKTIVAIVQRANNIQKRTEPA